MTEEADRISLERHLTTLIEGNDRRYEQRFVSQEKAIAAAFASAESALQKADATMVRDKAQANEWRQAMNDRETNFVGRPEYSAEIKAIREEIKVLAGTRGAGLNAAWGYFMGVIGAMIGIAAVVTEIFVHR